MPDRFKQKLIFLAGIIAFPVAILGLLRLPTSIQDLYRNFFYTGLDFLPFHIFYILFIIIANLVVLSALYYFYKEYEIQKLSKIDNYTNYALRLLVGGLLFTLIGLGLFMWGLSHMTLW